MQLALPELVGLHCLCRVSAHSPEPGSASPGRQPPTLAARTFQDGSLCCVPCWELARGRCHPCPLPSWPGQLQHQEEQCWKALPSQQ